MQAIRRAQGAYRGSHDISRVTLHVLLLLALALPVCSVHAQGITVTNASADYFFAQRATFRISAKSDVEIRSAVVVVRLKDRQEARLNASFTAGKTIEAAVDQPLTGGVWPPFSPVTYGWELSDAAGRKLTTPMQSFEYLDNRFAWQDASDGIVRVHTSASDAAYARTALDVARTALPRLNQELQAQLPAHVDLYLYTALDDLQSALLLAGRDWQGGQARPELGVALAAIPPGQGALAQMKRDIPHELTHLLVYQAAGANYAHVPRWLDEGLASANEELAQPAYQLALEAAAREGQLIPLETLCAPFPADAGAAQLAYAQSQSVVQYLRNVYPGGIRKLLTAYAGGATCSGGVEQALGLTLGALDWRWRAAATPQGTFQTLAGSAGAWVLLAVLVSLALLPLAFVRRKTKPADTVTE
jgi:hypothetical protein